MLESSAKSYYRARYYDPAEGRFLTEDPLGFGGGPNKSDYVSSSPLNFRDPQGLCQQQSSLQCAASLSQAGSLNKIFGIELPLGSNTFGDAVGAVVGPGSLGERVDQGASAASEGALHIAASAAPHIAIGSAPVIGLPVSATPGVYNPVPISESTATLGGAVPEVATVASAAHVILLAKLGADAVVFAAALGICKWY